MFLNVNNVVSKMGLTQKYKKVRKEENNFNVRNHLFPEEEMLYKKGEKLTWQ